MLIHRVLVRGDMATGLKTTSSTIIVSGTVTESGANTFTQAAIDLQLNPLDNEVFVIQAVDMDVGSPDALAGTDTEVMGSLSQTNRATMGNLSDTNVFGVAKESIRAAGYVDGGVGFTKVGGETPAIANLDYIAVLATDSFFAQIEGFQNTVPKTMNFKLYGYRARAAASVYAALVQSELLSS